MKLRILLSILFVVAAGLLFATLRPSLSGGQGSAREAAYNELVATHFYDRVDRMFAVPITVSREMAADSLLKGLLQEEESRSAEEIEASISDYLSSIKDQFGYIASFFDDTATTEIYTPSGISKVVNPEQDAYDIWYQIFLDSGKELDLDTDRDQVNDYRWTVFVNVRMHDDDGSLLGICGVGLFMDELQELVESCENEYGLKLNLVDDKGLVQVDVDASNIENAYLSDAIGDKVGSDSFTYVKKSFGGFRMTRAMEDLDWYLVVQGSGGLRSGMPAWLAPSLLCLLLVALYVLAMYAAATRHSHALSNTPLPEDPLTGLPNRNYLNESFGELGVFNTTRYKSLAMFDIDRFKSINETKDGDAIILRIVALSKELVDDRGLIFRWSGDEFVFFLEMGAEEAEEKFKALCSAIYDELDVSISVGIVDIDLFESIKRNYHRAVQRCYAVKEAGGNGVCRKL